jgi:hypothetical protein
MEFAMTSVASLAGLSSALIQINVVLPLRRYAGRIGMIRRAPQSAPLCCGVSLTSAMSRIDPDLKSCQSSREQQPTGIGNG